MNETSTHTLTQERQQNTLSMELEQRGSLFYFLLKTLNFIHTYFIYKACRLFLFSLYIIVIMKYLLLLVLYLHHENLNTCISLLFFPEKLDEKAETLCVVLIIVMLLCTQDIINEKALIKSLSCLDKML